MTVAQIPTYKLSDFAVQPAAVVATLNVTSRNALSDFHIIAGKLKSANKYVLQVFVQLGTKKY